MVGKSQIQDDCNNPLCRIYACRNTSLVVGWLILCVNIMLCYAFWVTCLKLSILVLLSCCPRKKVYLIIYLHSRTLHHVHFSSVNTAWRPSWKDRLHDITLITFRIEAEYSTFASRYMLELA